MFSDDQDWEPPSEADMKLIAARRERADKISKLMAGYLLRGYKMLGSVCDKCDTILLQDRGGTNLCVACSELGSDTDKDDPAINESAAISMARELEMASAAGSVAPSGSVLVSGASPAIQASAVTEGDINTVTTGQALTSASTYSSPSPAQRAESKPKLTVDSVTPNLSMTSIDVQSFTTTVVSDAKHQNSPRQSVSVSKSMADGGGDSGISSFRVEDKKPFIAGRDCVGADADSIHVSRIQDKIRWASKELESTPSLEYSIQLCTLMKTAAEAIVALRNARL